MPTEYDEDDDLEIGFKSVTTEDSLDEAKAPSSEQTPAPDAPAAPAEATDPKPEPEADPFAAYPQAVRDLLAQVPKLVGEVESLRRTAGQVPKLQSEIDRLKSARETAPPSPQGQTATPPQRPRFEKVEKLRESMPDDLMEAIDEIASAIPSPTQRANPEPAATPAAPTAEAPTDDPVFRALDGARPGWAQTINSTDFQLWLVRQPEQFQHEMRSTGDPKTFLDGLKAFDTFTAQATPTTRQPSRTTQRMAAAVTPRGDGRTGRAPPPLIEDEEADMELGFSGRHR